VFERLDAQLVLGHLSRQLSESLSLLLNELGLGSVRSKSKPVALCTVAPLLPYRLRDVFDRVVKPGPKYVRHERLLKEYFVS